MIYIYASVDGGHAELVEEIEDRDDAANMIFKLREEAKSENLKVVYWDEEE